jgi:uncharacterized protein (DUF1697 family)
MMHIALLRGINVGGKNKLPMKDLAAFFQDAAAKNVQTYIQSGNVVFEADKPNEVADKVCARIQGELGYNCPIVLRSSAELAKTLANNPYAATCENEKELFVMFLRDQPSAAAVAGLDPNRSAPDEFQVIGADIYLRIVTSAATTKLTNAYFDSRLKTMSTSRNWRTVGILAEMSHSVEP